MYLSPSHLTGQSLSEVRCRPLCEIRYRHFASLPLRSAKFAELPAFRFATASLASPSHIPLILHVYLCLIFCNSNRSANSAERISLTSDRCANSAERISQLATASLASPSHIPLILHVYLCLIFRYSARSARSAANWPEKLSMCGVKKCTLSFDLLTT